MTPRLCTFFALILLLLVLISCGNDRKGKRFSVDRSIQNPVVVADEEGGSFLLQWLEPPDTVDLRFIHIWIDTCLVTPSDESASKEAMSDLVGHIKLPVPDPKTGKIPVELNLAGKIDETTCGDNMLESRDEIGIALWAEYSGGSSGQIRWTSVVLRDNFSPSRITLAFERTDRDLRIFWTRPQDRVNFYQPEVSNGQIVGYNVEIRAIDTSENLRNASVQLLDIAEGGSGKLEMSSNFHGSKPLEIQKITDIPKHHLRFMIHDSSGYVSSENEKANDWQIRIDSLQAQKSYNVWIYVFDSLGNSNESDQELVRLTDSIRPVIPKKLLDWNSTPGRGRVELSWNKALDPFRTGVLAGADTTLWESCSAKGLSVAAGNCFADVSHYLFWQVEDGDTILLRGSSERRYPLDTSEDGRTFQTQVLKDTLFFMVPGTEVFLLIQAVDSSGYASDYLEEHIRLPWSDSALALGCPSHMIPIARDSNSFCMERFEHMEADSFSVSLRWQEAKEICSNTPDSLSGLVFSLCSEKQWNEACSGGENLEYGILTYGDPEEFSPANLLFGACNQATDYYAGALSLEDRSSFCISSDGVRDLPGQLQEWVSTPYLDSSRGLSDSISGTIKGSGTLRYTGLSTDDHVKLARCSARSTGFKTRPDYELDTVYVYERSGFVDTLFDVSEDTSQILKALLLPKDFRDSLDIYSLRDTQGKTIAYDSLDRSEVVSKGTSYLELLFAGQDYQRVKSIPAYIRGQSARPAGAAYRHRGVGFRCCALPVNP